MSDMYGDDLVVDLDGVDAIHGFVPVPTAIYVLQITDAKVVPTKDGHNKNIEFRNQIAEGQFNGRSIGIDRIFVPNRETQTPEAYKTTAGYFKGKIESMTGKPYVGRLNVREMVGLRYKGIVVLKDDGYGPQNEITAYLPLTADTTGIVLPASSGAPRQKSAPSGGSPEAAAAGRFKI